MAFCVNKRSGKGKTCLLVLSVLGALSGQAAVTSASKELTGRLSRVEFLALYLSVVTGRVQTSPGAYPVVTYEGCVQASGVIV
eukprot:scaffold50786_cov20-Tisochrysis_lutea.AAC.2